MNRKVSVFLGFIIGFVTYLLLPDPYKLASIPIGILASWIIFTA